MLPWSSRIAAALALGATIARATVLVDFQVAQPPPLPKGAKQCTVQILKHTFGNSFGAAEVVQFEPPTDCGPVGSWAGISLNFTVTSNGTQFDRLGIFTFQNVEIWRTSTPEPTRGDGIIWTYLKDVTRYTPLFAKNGTFILQLDNLLETGLDGQYATTLDATFFASDAAHPPAPKADLIIPVSTLANNTGNDASVPPQFSLNVTVPRNAVQIFAELYASGNGNEEFWYFNTANEFLDDLPSGTTFGQGPFREVRMLVDGQLAGVAFPYAVIFTGGIVPTAWRPITSYGALDLPTYFLDLTPFVPVLTDGAPHEIALDVVSAEADHGVNQNWFVSGLLQVVLDPSGLPTTGRITRVDAPAFAATTTTGRVGANGDVNVTVGASRTLEIAAEITGGSGATTAVVWRQTLAYANTQRYLENTTVQVVDQSATGSSVSTHNGVPVLVDEFSYPLLINFTLLSPDGSQFECTFDHSYDRKSDPAPFILGSTIQERQLASGFFKVASTGNTGNGTNSNTFSYADDDGNTFSRKVSAVNNNITSDVQSGSLAPAPAPASAVQDKHAGMQAPLAITKLRLPGGRTIGN
ncbi:peptide N-acetyl-beta-D-glucosaminyl asparaginase amidase A-domain-containing protein [Epithele typhae]|uniref:peptide N-acetyl-beta-D-glucosaminyl asparaginase amidase A-domain-containing protein n=1 Tax=Epithele typhae TaxID=378194 RepID=UPI002008DD11|nr:peptide N-acetyl-beta-D-glucosaminyl asparaginase amidase A-domain-containing protein [Epithele typhae]KAH9945923.1 peptide N-acetyl-beta-D-glucosaminyl asparaginase amidase A-domain-containing protein [Epithele typhae]